MDVIEINVWAKPGKPAAVGHIGTLVLSEKPNESGEYLAKFTLRRRARKRLGQSDQPKMIDRNKRKRQD